MITPPKRRWHTIPSLDDKGEIPLTPEAHARMKERLARLKTQIPSLAAEAGEAAAQGDRSENDAYKEAKGLLRRAQRQILTLEDQLKRVVEISSGSGKDGLVRLGSTVKLELTNGKDKNTGRGRKKNDDSSRKMVFRIVGPFETDPTSGRISNKSPLGAALLGHAEGDVVTVRAANGTIHYHIIAIH